jgi:L-ascorbate metabolism protein UlaG (beta-lactamase superfamily)
MNIKQIRNATVLIEYANKKFLVDPVFSDKGTLPAFGPEAGLPEAPRQDQLNPLVDLPVSIDELVNVDAVILTHLHLDHYDPAAKEKLPKKLKVFVQNEEDALQIKEDGFLNVEVLSDTTVFDGIRLIKTEAQHGRGEILKAAGHACGVLFKHENEKALYLAGDTVWYEKVEENIKAHNPEVIIVNGGDNQFLIGGSLIMGKEDIYQVSQSAPDAQIFVTHMEAVNHWTLSREELKTFAKEKNIESAVFVPDDGQSRDY